MPLIPGNLLSENNQSVETSVGSWTNWMPESSAVVQSTEQSHDGSNSVKCTSTGDVGTLCGVTTTGNAPFVSASTQYTYSVWLYTSVASVQCSVNIDWYQSNNSTYISSFLGSDTPLTQNAWTKVTELVTSPSGAGIARIYVHHSSGLSSGSTIYVDEVFFGIPEGDAEADAGTGSATSVSNHPRGFLGAKAGGIG